VAEDRRGYFPTQKVLRAPVSGGEVVGSLALHPTPGRRPHRLRRPPSPPAISTFLRQPLGGGRNHLERSLACTPPAASQAGSFLRGKRGRPHVPAPCLPIPLHLLQAYKLPGPRWTDPHVPEPPTVWRKRFQHPADGPVRTCHEHDCTAAPRKRCVPISGLSSTKPTLDHLTEPLQNRAAQIKAETLHLREQRAQTHIPGLAGFCALSRARTAE